MKKDSHADRVLAILRPLAGITLTAETLSDVTGLKANQVRQAVNALRQADELVHVVGHSKYVYDSSRPIEKAAPRGRAVAMARTSHAPEVVEIPDHLTWDEREMLDVLRRRTNWLTTILDDWKGNNPSYARAERKALIWAIGRLEGGIDVASDLLIEQAS